MPNPTRPQYVTANHLLTGEVVFLAAGGRWVEDLTRAELFSDPGDAAARLRRAAADAGRVVDPYLAEASGDGAEPMPVHFRERFRAVGPSNYPHGKQERAGHV